MGLKRSLSTRIGKKAQCEVSKTVGWLTSPAWTVHEILTDNIPFLVAVCNPYDVPYNSRADLCDQL